MNQQPANTYPRSRALRHAAMVGCIAALAWGSASAQYPLQAVDECMETSTELVGLPSTSAGMLDARQCTTCDRVYLSFESGTQFFVGRRAVPYSSLLVESRKGPQSMVVCYRPGPKTLTALRLQ